MSEDGRRAYRTEDRRRAFYDDGEELTREEISKVHWRHGAPSWEQRQAAGEAVRQAKQAHENLEAIRPGRIITVTVWQAAMRSPKTISRT